VLQLGLFVGCLLLRQLLVLHCRLRNRSAGVEIETDAKPSADQQVSDSTGTCAC
jgi:hypothetical protein